MTSSWELPDSPRRRVVRSAPSPVEAPVAAQTKQSKSRIAWITVLVLAVIVLGGASVASRSLYLQRVDARYEKHCEALTEARKWRELKATSQKWLAQNPSSVRAIIFAARSAENLSEFDEAAKLLLSVPRADPRSPAAVASAAEIELAVLNRPLDAVKHFEEAIALHPDAPPTKAKAEARQRLIFFYAMTMQRRKMIEQIEIAIKLGQETRENYVYLVGSEWLIFSNGPQYNNLWRKSDVENEHFNVARALGVVANGFVAPPEERQMMGLSPSILNLSGTGIDPNAPPDRQGREAHYEAILRAYLDKYPNNLELLSYFLSRSTSAGDLKATSTLLARLPPEAEDDSRFWRYKANWQLMKSKRATDKETAFRESQEAEKSLLRAIELNPFDATSRHVLAGILREAGETARVDRLEAIYNEGAEIRRLVLQAPSAHVDPEIFARIKDFVALCGESDIANAMAKRLQLSASPDFLPGPGGLP
jgi:tetratricopeptide (TPR) repeat protein